MSNFDGSGRLLVATPATIGTAGGDTAGAQLVVPVAATWTLNSLIQGPNGVLSRAGVAGKSHYVCGIIVIINGSSTGDSYLSYGTPVGTELLQWYGGMALAFPNPIQVPTGQQVNIGFENSAAGTYFRINAWGYTA